MHTTLKEYINEYLNYKLQNQPNYTYEEAKTEIIKKLHEKYNNKIVEFNKTIEYNYDANGMPKLIHFTLKNKNNIDNPIWKECFDMYVKMYPDYQIILYDDNDIFNIINNFDKKNIGLIKGIKKGAILADIFRYLILYLRGGYYSDMDCVPVKRIDQLIETQYHGDANNDITICPTNSKLTNKAHHFYSNPCTNCKLTHNYNSFKVFNCKGHQYIKPETSIIVCYEFEQTWHTELIKSTEKEKCLWTDNNIGICQWFIGAKPKEKLFMECYKKSLKNIQPINFDDKDNYHFNVINSTGPLFFTKIINKYSELFPDFNQKIAILPSDYFCCGSGFANMSIPSTKNKFIEHQFTGTWLK
jgi:mannosyltransferase OCH1-like enzyme